MLKNYEDPSDYFPYHLVFLGIFRAKIREADKTLYAMIIPECKLRWAFSMIENGQSFMGSGHLPIEEFVDIVSIDTLELSLEQFNKNGAFADYVNRGATNVSNAVIKLISSIKGFLKLFVEPTNVIMTSKYLNGKLARHCYIDHYRCLKDSCF